MSQDAWKCALSEDGDDGISLRCESCDFETNDYRTKWRDHLLGQPHQTIAWERQLVNEFCLFCERISRPHPSSRMSKYVDSKKRSCVVFGIGGLPRRDVLRFFCEKAVVTEFIFWEQRPQICLIEFLLPKAAEDVVRGTKSIRGDDVVVRLRVELSDVEWRRIRPMSVEMGVEEMEALEMRDGGPIIPHIAHKSALKVKTEEEERPSEVSMRRSGSEEAAVVWPNPSKIRAASSQMKPTVRSAILSSSVTHSSSDEENNNESGESSLRKRKWRGCPEFECGDSPAPAKSCLPGSSKGCVRTPKKHRRVLHDAPNMKGTDPLPKLLFGDVLCDILCPFHTLRLAASKKFVARVAAAKKCDIETIHKNLHEGMWAQLVHEFNLLVWENLFGFQLNAVSPADITKLRRMKEGVVQGAPLIEGTLTHMDKMAKWTQRPGKGKFRAPQDSFMKDWKAGLVRPNPLRPSRDDAGSASVFLRFDLRVVCSEPQGRIQLPVHCHLQFYNIASSFGVEKWGLFVRIRGMYHTLFRQFCLRRLIDL